MPTMRKRAKTQEPSSTPNSVISDDHTQSKKLSLYEQSREERIKENLERMQKFGIADLAQKLRSSVPPKRTQHRKSVEKSTPVLPPAPVRRSSRLQNVIPVSYSEVKLTKKDALLEDTKIVLEEGSKPEIYTEEHDKLLGNTEKNWELFVDGYGKDGRRIYDPIKGKTCHQCRQKTLGHRTNCSQCNRVQGQFCGDCLYMRYGEHVLEALQNPNWTCPVCRGICNCSLCRQAKGWAPTGPLYKKISNLGYKSVAHYLIQTRRVQTVQEKTSDSPIYASAKRSLPFSETEIVANESPPIIRGNGVGFLEPNLDLKMEQEENSVHASAKRSLPFSGKEPHEFDEGRELLGPKNAVNSPELVHRCNYNVEATPDTIAGRLRLRRRMRSGDIGEPAELEKGSRTVEVIDGC